MLHNYRIYQKTLGRDRRNRSSVQFLTHVTHFMFFQNKSYVILKEGIARSVHPVSLVEHVLVAKKGFVTHLCTLSLNPHLRAPEIRLHVFLC